MESLEILNGKLSPKYDKYNDIYTVSISSDINELEIKYSTNENEMVNIYGNTNLQEGKNKWKKLVHIHCLFSKKFLIAV